MAYYFRITTARGDSHSKRETIGGADFRAAVGDRPPEVSMDVSGLFRDGGDPARIERVASVQAEESFPAATSVWRISKESGRVEGWPIAS